MTFETRVGWLLLVAVVGPFVIAAVGFVGHFLIWHHI